VAATPRSRPFGLSDALLLVAATALGLALTRSLSGFLAIDRSESINYRSNGPTPIGHRFTLSRAYGEIRPPTSQVAHVRFWIERAAFWPCPCLLAWTSVVLARGVLPPRRPRFKSLRQPGIMAGVACLAAFCLAALESPGMLVTWWPKSAPPEFHWEDWWLFTWYALPRSAGYSVALTWLVLILSGCWAANRGWLDRLGRFIGLCWIGLALLTELASCLMTIQ
jgi:hypothetical protein